METKDERLALSFEIRHGSEIKSSTPGSCQTESLSSPRGSTRKDSSTVAEDYT